MTRPMYVCILYIKLITSYYIRCVHIRYMYKWPTNDDLKVALFSNASWPRGGAERKTSCFQSPKQNGFVWKEGTVPQNPLVHHFSYSNCDFSDVIPTFGHMQMGSPTWNLVNLVTPHARVPRQHAVQLRQYQSQRGRNWRYRLQSTKDLHWTIWENKHDLGRFEGHPSIPFHSITLHCTRHYIHTCIYYIISIYIYIVYCITLTHAKKKTTYHVYIYINLPIYIYVYIWKKCRSTIQLRHKLRPNPLCSGRWRRLLHWNTNWVRLKMAYP